MKKFEEITNMVQVISTISHQMSDGTYQIVHSIKGISDISGVTTMSAEKVTSSVEEQTSTMKEITTSATTLAEMSIKLQEAVSGFKV